MHDDADEQAAELDELQTTASRVERKLAAVIEATADRASLPAVLDLDTVRFVDLTAEHVVVRLYGYEGVDGMAARRSLVLRTRVDDAQPMMTGIADEIAKRRRSGRHPAT